MTYAPDRLQQEVAYIAYHFSWSQAEILDLEHEDRRRYVEAIAEINRAQTQGR